MSTNLHLVNTIQFSEAAQFKLRNGVYTKAPYGTKDYKEFWDEQDKRCLEGYSVGGVRITGRHYFFLNFKQLEVVLNTTGVASRKERIFPKFWEAHYHFFHALEQSEIAGKHFCVLKPRGIGFSEIMASNAVRDYTLIRGSKSFFFASNEGFLNKDGVITKCWDHLEFLNSETERAYRHLRQKKDQDLHKRASMINPKTGNEYGFKSEIIARVIDHPRKVRGARTGSYGKVYFEEGGSFPNLKDAVIATRPLVEQGGITTGQIIVWGTGGETGPGIEGLEHMFYHPNAYNMMPFENTWEDDRIGTRSCYFIPVYACMDKYMNEDGVADIEAAKQHHVKERELIHKEDPRSEDKVIAEYPFTPAEALIRLSSNIFPVAELQRQLLKVQTDRNIQGFMKHGWMLRNTNGKPKFQLDPTVRVINEFPHQNDGNLKGGVTLVEAPYKDQTGHVPSDTYLIVVDPYYNDQATDKTSLFSAYVYKHFNNVSPSEDDILVAWYVGRPDTLEEAYHQLFLLAEFYNATIQSEIQGGGKGILDYAKQKKLLQYCEKEPDIVYNKGEGHIKDYNKPYFMNMPEDRIKLALAYLADWLKTPRSALSDNGEQITIMNLHKIYDEALLKEFIKFNDEGNFDRVSALRLLPFMIKERSTKIYENRRDQSHKSFWSREFHSDENAHDEHLLSPWELSSQQQEQDNAEADAKYKEFETRVKPLYDNNLVHPEDF
jgi:hypothetical protein